MLVFVRIIVVQPTLHILIRKWTFRNIPHYQMREVVIVFLPLLLLIIRGYFRLLHLYSTSSRYLNRALTVKIVAHQWFWTYEVGGNREGTRGYIITTEELPLGEKRLLRREGRLVLPVNTKIRLLFTRRDVGHSWALPRHLLKVDCWPGLLNALHVRFEQVGVFRGQCSELCGAGHRFIPTIVEIVPYGAFLRHLITLKG